MPTTDTCAANTFLFQETNQLMPLTKRTGLLFLALICVLSLFSGWPAQSASMVGPQQTYARAWQLVRDNYYDPSFNGQNWTAWQNKFDGQLHSQEEAFEAIKKMLASLNDPYTRLLDPKAFKEENDAINSVVCGIGISLKPYKDTKALIINEVIDGGPAKIAGLAEGDKIVAIDGEASIDYDNDKAADKIRGRAGSAVQIKIQRGETAKNFKIVRQRILIPAVTAKVLPENIGYIKLSTFMSDDASAEFKYALQRLNGTDGLIVDMRNNPGGLLANAIEIADMLLARGKIVTTVSRRGKLTDGASGMQVSNLPIVVLVDSDSASASEILAGALKDNGRAVVVGSKTFGKGLVQEINRLPGGGGVHVTVARYFTPNGRDINKVGIVPDVVVSERDKQMKAAIDIIQNRVANKGTETIMSTGPKRLPQLPGFQRIFSPRS